MSPATRTRERQRGKWAHSLHPQPVRSHRQAPLKTSFYYGSKYSTLLGKKEPELVLPTFLFFSPSFLAALRHMELLGQGSELSCSLELSHRCCDARFLMHCAGLGIELHPSASQDAANPIVPQWELLSSHPEFAFFFMLVPQPGPYLLCLLMGALPDWSFHDIEPWLDVSGGRVTNDVLIEMLTN